MNNLSALSNPRAQGRNKNAASVSAATPVKNGATSASADKRKEVCFELDASSAREVLLAGDFTGWEKTPIKLTKGDRGAWRATVKLAPGQYHYRYVVDGQWQDDPAASSSIPNPFGSSNSVLKIS